jgi:hypothetical protein
MKNGGWLDAYDDKLQLGGNVYPANYVPQAENGIEGTMSGLTDQGFNYNGAWGGTMQFGGNLPGAVGSMYARIGAPSNGPYAKKTMASAKDGEEVEYKELPEIVVVGKNNKSIKEREDFKPWWNWGSVQAAGGERRQQTYGNLGDLYAYYAGQPLKHNVLEHSQYKPTNAKNPKADYISINDSKFKQEIIDNYNRVFNEKKLLRDEKQVNDNTYAVSGYTRPTKEQMKKNKAGELYYEKGKDHVSNAIGHYYLSRGKDSKGDYISYYDVFDADTGPDGGGVGETLGLTKPFELYDRIYLDPKTGKPKFQNGGEVSFYQNGLDWTPRNISKNGSEIPQAQMGTMVTPLDFSKPLGTLQGVSEVMSAPARTATYLLTGKYQDPSQALGIKNPWGALAADAVFDPMNLIGAGVATKAAKAARAATKASMESGALSKAYKYNPYAFKPNPEAYYRMLGKEGYEDALQSGMIRPKQHNDLMTLTPEGSFDFTPKKGQLFNEVYFDKGNLAEHYGGPYAVEYKTPIQLEEVSGYPKGYYISNENIPINDQGIKFFKQDWLKGYKEVSKGKKKEGGEITKDDNGYWNPENWGKPVEIDSNQITMQGVYEPLLGISDTGDTQMMYPGEDYKFKGKKVTEYPVKKNGGWLDKWN